MQLMNEFRVDADPATTWTVLTDLERIAPCMPGAELQEVEGDEYRGIVKVKVGPVTAQYKGTASFVELDEAGGRAVVSASGRDTRGQGNASATITATLTPDGTGTRVEVATDLTITGKVAQFGRGVMADVSAKLLGEFVDSLESTVLQPDGPTADPSPGADPGDPGPASGDPAADAAGPRRIESRPATPVDILDAAGAPIAKRLAPVVVAIVVFFVLRALARRRR